MNKKEQETVISHLPFLSSDCTLSSLATYPNDFVFRREQIEDSSK